MFHVMYHISCGSDVDTKVKLRALLTDSHIYIYIFNLSLYTFSFLCHSFLFSFTLQTIPWIHTDVKQRFIKTSSYSATFFLLLWNVRIADVLYFHSYFHYFFLSITVMELILEMICEANFIWKLWLKML